MPPTMNARPTHPDPTPPPLNLVERVNLGAIPTRAADAQPDRLNLTP